MITTVTTVTDSAAYEEVIGSAKRMHTVAMDSKAAGTGEMQLTTTLA